MNERELHIAASTYALAVDASIELEAMKVANKSAELRGGVQPYCSSTFFDLQLDLQTKIRSLHG